MRGQAGTHDIELAHQTLKQLKSATSESSEVGLVRYDKSSNEGRGDRAPASKWQQVKGKVDVVLFEGWMLGFKPLTDQAAEKVILEFLSCLFLSHTLHNRDDAPTSQMSGSSQTGPRNAININGVSFCVKALTKLFGCSQPLLSGVFGRCCFWVHETVLLGRWCVWVLGLSSNVLLPSRSKPELDRVGIWIIKGRQEYQHGHVLILY